MTQTTREKQADQVLSRRYASDYQHQQNVDGYFTTESRYWKDLYTSEQGVVGQIIRDRQARALQLIDGLGLSECSTALEVGCGAGFLSIALAGRGFNVNAVDSSEAMVDRARHNSEEAGANEWLSIEVGNIHNLSFGDRSFDLVVAIGVLPWIDRRQEAVEEVARVTKPGGYVLFTNANRLELRNLLDPWRYPPLRPLKLGLKRTIERIGLRPVTPSMTFDHSTHIDEMVAKAGLEKVHGVTLGFGPFSLFGRPIVPQPIGIAMHHQLQALADSGVPVFRATGMSYMVLARMPAAR